MAEDIWDHYGFDFGTDFSGLYKALSHINYNVRVAAAEALAAALDEHPDSIQVCLVEVIIFSSGRLLLLHLKKCDNYFKFLIK